jgi:hypothetical protein
VPASAALAAAKLIGEVAVYAPCLWLGETQRRRVRTYSILGHFRPSGPTFLPTLEPIISEMLVSTSKTYFQYSKRYKSKPILIKRDFVINYEGVKELL